MSVQRKMKHLKVILKRFGSSCSCFFGYDRVPSLNVLRGKTMRALTHETQRRINPRWTLCSATWPVCLAVCMSYSPSSYSSIHLLSWCVWRNEQIAHEKKKKTNTVGSLPCASEVQCLFWSYLKRPLKKKQALASHVFLLSLESLLPLLSPSNTPRGQSTVQSTLEWRNKNSIKNCFSSTADSTSQKECAMFLIMHTAQHYIALSVREIQPSLLFLLESFVGFLGDHVIWHH